MLWYYGLYTIYKEPCGEDVPTASSTGAVIFLFIITVRYSKCKVNFIIHKQVLIYSTFSPKMLYFIYSIIKPYSDQDHEKCHFYRSCLWSVIEWDDLISIYILLCVNTNNVCQGWINTQGKVGNCPETPLLLLSVYRDLQEICNTDVKYRQQYALHLVAPVMKNPEFKLFQFFKLTVETATF